MDCGLGDWAADALGAARLRSACLCGVGGAVGCVWRNGEFFANVDGEVWVVEKTGVGGDVYICIELVMCQVTLRHIMDLGVL